MSYSNHEKKEKSGNQNVMGYMNHDYCEGSKRAQHAHNEPREKGDTNKTEETTTKKLMQPQTMPKDVEEDLY